MQAQYHNNSLYMYTSVHILAVFHLPLFYIRVVLLCLLNPSTNSQGVRKVPGQTKGAASQPRW